MTPIRIIPRHVQNGEALKELRRGNNAEIAFNEGFFASLAREYLLRSSFTTGNIIDPNTGKIYVEAYNRSENVPSEVVGSVGQIFFIQGCEISLSYFNCHQDLIGLIAIEITSDWKFYNVVGWMTKENFDLLLPDPEFNRKNLVLLEDFKTQAGL